MFTIVTNVFIFAVYLLVLVTEFIFMRIFHYGYSTLWLITTLVYIMFIAYQVLARTNEYLEKGKVKEILYSIIDAINGIPLLNRDNKIVIRWDEIFKKLIDKKEYALYDNIIKIKTKTIDHYVNQYPSLLFDSSIDMVERKGKKKIDTNSVISGNGEKGNDEISGSEISEDIYKRLFVKYISADKVTLANIDSSIYIDVLLNDEYEPQDYEKLGTKPDSRYDGFSVVAFHKDQKYCLVPRTMVLSKRIDKEKWLYRNLERILQCAENIASGTPEYGIVVDELSLKDITSDYIEEEPGKFPDLSFVSIEDNLLMFSGSEKGKEKVRAYCALDMSRNGFEIRLVKYIKMTDGEREEIDDDKSVAIGSAYQPMLLIMEKMPIIANNIKKAIQKKDINDLVIK